eukprot:5707452-Pyramimonas_sp.AAC.3
MTVASYSSDARASSSQEPRPSEIAQRIAAWRSGKPKYEILLKACVLCMWHSVELCNNFGRDPCSG